MVWLLTQNEITQWTKCVAQSEYKPHASALTRSCQVQWKCLNWMRRTRLNISTMTAASTAGVIDLGRFFPFVTVIVGVGVGGEHRCVHKKLAMYRNMMKILYYCCCCHCFFHSFFCQFFGCAMQTADTQFTPHIFFGDIVKSRKYCFTSAHSLDFIL